MMAADFETQCEAVLKALKGTDGEERKHALSAAKRVVRLLQTPLELCQEQTWAPVELAAAASACELEIFKALASKPATPMTIAEITNLSKSKDELLVQRIVQSLAAHYMVDQLDIDKYQANDVTKEYTTPGRVGHIMTQLFSMRAFSSLPYNIRELGYNMPTSFRNCAWQHAYGTDETMFEWMKTNPEMGGYFQQYMSAPRPHLIDDLVDVYPFKDLLAGSKEEDVIFVDVAGGVGHQCLNMRKYFPRERGRIVLQELPHVIEGKQVKDVQVQTHDMMTEQPIKGAKVYYFRAILHDHDDERCREFLRQTVEAMDSNSRLLVHDVVIEDFMPSQQFTRQDLGMMSLVAGMERTERQMKALLESVGLKVVGTHRPGPEKSSITEARL